MGIADLLVSPVATLITDLIDRVFPDKDKQAAERSAFMLKAQELDAELAKGQMAINQAEASNTNVFVAGWRPFVGWVCGVAFAYNFVLLPFMLFVATSRAWDMKALPSLDTGSLVSVLMGMLGLGTLRTVEKMADKGHMPWQAPATAE